MEEESQKPESGDAPTIPPPPDSIDMSFFAPPRLTIVEPPVMNIEDDAPKRSLKPKKKKLTKAERKAKKLKEAMEFRKLEFRDKLQRELELSKRAEKRGMAEWEEMCKEIKLIELREEVDEWTEKSKRWFDQKNEKITSLLDEMDDMHNMQKRNFAKQIETIDFLIKTFNTIVTCSKRMYESDASEMLENFMNDLNAKALEESRRKLQYENIMYASSLMCTQTMRSDYQIFLERRDDCISKEIKTRYALRDACVAKMEKMQQLLENFVQALTSSSLDASKNERVQSLMDRQKTFVLETQKLNEIEFRNIRLYGEMQRELVHNELEAQRRMNDLRLEHAYFLKVRKGVETRLEQEHNESSERLRVLCNESYQVIKKFEEIVKNGELLLSAVAICAKYETESEKIVDGSAFLPTAMVGEEDDGDIEPFKLKILNLMDHVDISEEDLIQQAKCLKNFWRRQAIVQAQCLSLEEEKRRLIEENQKYKKMVASLSKTKEVEDLEKLVTVTNIIPVLPLPCKAAKPKTRK